MDTKAEVSAEYELTPALAALGGEVIERRFNAGNGVLHLVVALADFTWERRRQVLDAVTAWQNGLADDVDVRPVVLSTEDLASA